MSVVNPKTRRLESIGARSCRRKILPIAAVTWSVLAIMDRERGSKSILEHGK